MILQEWLGKIGMWPCWVGHLVPGVLLGFAIRGCPMACAYSMILFFVVTQIQCIRVIVVTFNGPTAVWALLGS